MTEAIGHVADAREVVRARIAVSAAFLMFGLTLGLWAVHIPTIAGRLHLDPAILGLALLNVGLGGVFSQPLTGWLIARSGSLLPARILVPLCLVVFVLPIVAWSVPVFFLATLLLGAAGGANNVAINTQASEIERARGKPTMSSFHGFFSLGALGGASLGGAIIAVHRQDGSGAAAVIAVLLVIALVAGWYFLRSPPPPQRPREPGARRLAIPSLAVLSLSVLVFFSNTVEGAVNDWSALYLSTVRGFEPATAVSGFALFSLAMAFCRLAGGPVVARLGKKSIVLFGGIIMAVGMGIVVFSPWAIVSPLGFAFVAVGAANTIPVMMGAASRSPGTSRAPASPPPRPAVFSASSLVPLSSASSPTHWV